MTSLDCIYLCKDCHKVYGIAELPCGCGSKDSFIPYVSQRQINAHLEAIQQELIKLSIDIYSARFENIEELSERVYQLVEQIGNTTDGGK